uniref:Coiled-coil and C2 domain-containing protein 2A n=1 Tax=Schistosoma haematobium TaxID=6185 RepID=A0A095AUR8_SCHHA
MTRTAQVPPVEIKQRSIDKRRSLVEEEIKDPVVQKDNQSISTSSPMKYEQSKQFSKSKSYYPLPERMQRLRKSTGLGELSTSPEVVPIELKTGGKLPRYLEDEGYYIGKQPYVAPTNLRRLENRILKEIQMDSWFREDGSLDLQPNPLRNIPSRPPLWDEQFNPMPEKLQTVYVHPMSFEMTQNLFNMESKGLTSQNLSATLSQCKHIGLLNNNNGNTEYRLHVDIRRVTFDFHPLFSLEHVHVQNLRQIIQAYELTLSRDQVNACIQRINALQRALKKLEEKRNNNASILSQDELLEMDYRIEDYYHEISLMRRARNHAEAYEKGLLTSALRAWKRVKEARQTSGCTNTTVRLKITKQITNVEQDQADWNQELDDIDAALRRQRLRESGQIDGDWEDNAELEREDAQCLAQKTRKNPPIIPKSFNAQVIRDETEVNLRKFRRLPNEPKITVSLVDDLTISSNNECPRTEINRRLKLLEYTYFIKLYYNRKLVETSQPQFSVNFIWFLFVEQTQLFEKHGWTSHQIAEFHIGLPNYADIQNTSIQQMNRSSELDLQHLRFIVTTGSSFKLDQSKSNQKQSSLSSSSSFVGRQPKILLEDLDGSGEKMVYIPTTGTLFATTKWISINSSLINDMDIEACIGYQDRSLYPQGSMKRHVTDLQSLIYPTTSYLQPTQLFQSNPLFLNDTSKDDNKQVYSTSILDPNNTMDAKLLNLIQTATGTHLLPNQQLQMTSYPEVLYHTRASGSLNEKKDPDDIHDVLSKGMKAYKQKRKVYLEKIKLEVNQHFQDILNKKSLREIVIEEEIPNILFLLPFFKRLLQPKRPLRPRYEERRRIGAQYVQNSSLELIVTIHGAYNLPNRSTKRTDQSNYRNKTDNINDLLKPFAVIKFQQNKQSTNSSEGRNPSWNTEFRFPFYLPLDNPKLENMKDPIIINIYDQVIFNQTDSNQTESSHYIQHIEHRLIGSTEIPLSTVYLNTKISGKINLSIPLILQGYETINLVKSSIRPMIDILMTLEPSIYPPTPLIDTFISIESLEVQTSLSKWYQKLSKHKFMTERQFKPLVMNSDCQEILMTRFLTPLNPPEELLPGTKTGFSISESMLRLARYVSLIPYESDIASFPGLVQVWCTCDVSLFEFSL